VGGGREAEEVGSGAKLKYDPAGNLLGVGVKDTPPPFSVPTDFLDPLTIRQPGIKYHNTITEEDFSKRPDSIKIAREIFGHLVR
jgi:hypothetical protein